MRNGLIILNCCVLLLLQGCGGDERCYCTDANSAYTYSCKDSLEDNYEADSCKNSDEIVCKIEDGLCEDRRVIVGACTVDSNCGETLGIDCDYGTWFTSSCAELEGACNQWPDYSCHDTYNAEGCSEFFLGQRCDDMQGACITSVFNGCTITTGEFCNYPNTFYADYTCDQAQNQP